MPKAATRAGDGIGKIRGKLLTLKVELRIYTNDPYQSGTTIERQRKQIYTID